MKPMKDRDSESPKWKSFAQWPVGTIAGSDDDISTDTHDTEAQAKAVCRMLRWDGFGGQGKIFPVRTWTAAE